MPTDNIVLLGASGQVGSELVGHEGVRPVTSAQLDLSNIKAIREFFADTRFNVIVNCAGFTNVDRAEVLREECFAVNTLAVEELVKLCDAKSAYFIHLSSDYVFDGFEGGYHEYSATNPLNFYGFSKAWSERLVQLYPNSLVIRTAHIFGNRANIVRFFADKVRRKQTVKIVKGSRVNITSAKDLARFIHFCIRERLTGIVNCANLGDLTWSELVEFLENRLDSKVEKQFIDSLPRPARRPLNSTLKLDRAKSLFHLDPWQVSVDKYLSENKYC